MTFQRATRVRAALRLAFLVLAGLYYLQFGLQALFHHAPQGALTLVGTVGISVGAQRSARGRDPWPPVLLGTLPLLLLHTAMTIEDTAELPFLVGSIPVPAVAAVLASNRRRRRTRDRVPQGTTPDLEHAAPARP